jgi:DNA-binding transcriptional MerR regulator
VNDDLTFFTTAELAELCRTNAATIKYWRKRGTGPRGIRVGRQVLYPRDVVLAWFQDLAMSAG